MRLIISLLVASICARAAVITFDSAVSEGDSVRYWVEADGYTFDTACDMSQLYTA